MIEVLKNVGKLILATPLLLSLCMVYVLALAIEAVVEVHNFLLKKIL